MFVFCFESNIIRMTGKPQFGQGQFSVFVPQRGQVIGVSSYLFSKMPKGAVAAGCIRYQSPFLNSINYYNIFLPNCANVFAAGPEGRNENCAAFLRP